MSGQPAQIRCAAAEETVPSDMDRIHEQHQPWSGRGIRPWILERWRESPAWVTSIVIHAVLMILLGTAT
ncbi:MAG: hypothetical protein N2C14_02995, partial [Planctomycetales bacterium]